MKENKQKLTIVDWFFRLVGVIVALFAIYFGVNTVIASDFPWILRVIVGAPLVGFLINGLFGKFLSNEKVDTIAIFAMFVAFFTSVGAVIKLAGHSTDSVKVVIFNWMAVGDFSVNFSFALDHLSSVMILIITGIGGLIHLYSVGYMHGDKSYSRFFTYLNLFVFAMLLLVLGSNMLIMFIGWEGVGLASYLLIGFWFTEDANAIAGKKAFITNRVGDFGFLIGIFLILGTVGSVEFSDVIAATVTHKAALAVPVLFGGSLVFWITLSLFIGATGKSAQIPLFVWLPDAMAGPTPVSALIHAATMVTAGVYMIVRLNPLFMLSPWTMTIIALIGAFTALFAASIALVQTDIKKVLAYSTVSQLGYMFLAVGVGAFGAGVMHLMTHAFFKATLFLGAGSVIHAMSGDQEMGNMGGLKKYLPHTSKAMFFATLAITGVFPFLSGWVSKDEILWKAFASENRVVSWLPTLLWVVGVLAAIMTSFYMWRLYFLTFHSGETRAEAKVKHHIHESPWTMTSVLWILGIFSIFIGLIGLPHLITHGLHLPNVFGLFHHWLAPIVEHSEKSIKMIHHGTGIEVTMMVISTGLALLAMGVAMKFYKKGISTTPNKIARGMKPVYNTLLHKYKVDELYQAMINGMLWISDKILFKTVDTILIDKVGVLGIGRVSSSIGNIVRLFQSGNMQYYALVMIAAFFALFMFMTL